MIKLIALEKPEWWLPFMNGIINTGVFPSEWKKTELVLIPKIEKGKDMLEPSSYRSLCLFTSTSKLLEQLIAIRMN